MAWPQCQCHRHSLCCACPMFHHQCCRWKSCCQLLGDFHPLPDIVTPYLLQKGRRPPPQTSIQYVPRHRYAQQAVHLRHCVCLNARFPAAASGGALSPATSALTQPSSTCTRLTTAYRPTSTTTTLTGPSAPSAYFRRRASCSATASRPCPLACLTATTQSGCPWVSGEHTRLCCWVPVRSSRRGA